MTEKLDRQTRTAIPGSRIPAFFPNPEIPGLENWPGIAIPKTDRQLLQVIVTIMKFIVDSFSYYIHWAMFINIKFRLKILSLLIITIQPHSLA